MQTLPVNTPGAVDGAEQLERSATHFLYFTRVDTRFFFGVVDGGWRVVAVDRWPSTGGRRPMAVDRIDPCSA